MRVIPVVLLQRLNPVLGRLHLRQRLTRLINVVNRAYNLANLLLVLVLILNLVLEIELEGLVLPRDVLDLRLQRRHMPLLPIQLFVEVLERLLLLLLDLLHFLCDAHLSLIQLFVLVLQISETVFQSIYCVLLAVVDILAIRNDLLEELRVLVQIAELALPVLQLHLLLVDALLQLLDRLLVVERSGIQSFESLVLLFTLLLVLEDLLLVGRDVGEYLPLALQERFLLVVELLRLRDDVLFLLGELLVNSPLLALLLEQADRLQRPLALHDEGANPRQILIADLRVGVLAHVLVDAVEQLIDLSLLVNVHLAVSRFVCNFSLPKASSFL